MTTWSCFLCDVTGLSAGDRLAALVAFERHYIHAHYRAGEAA